ncbi:MAG: thermonuclease family protein [Hyphomonadaceae bacterium]
MSGWAAALLVLGLVLFLASTRQMTLAARAAVWAAGFLVLVSAAGLVAADEEHTGLFRAAIDLAENWRDPSQSVLAQALSRNGPNVGRFVLPLLDLFLVLGAILGVFAAIAFTRGERIEKIMRPLAIGLIGAIGGGVLSLGVVGTGFGGVVEQRAYTNFVSVNDIQDGDTLWIGEISVRLLGADAPERRQICRYGAEIDQCGERAARHLRELLTEALVTCHVRENSRGRTSESFGRPLVTCSAVREGRRDEAGRVVQEREEIDDVARRLIADGYAVEFRSDQPSYRAAASRARNQGAGLTMTCSLAPSVWRRDRAAREAFVETGALPPGSDQTMGACAPAPSSDNRR